MAQQGGPAHKSMMQRWRSGLKRHPFAWAVGVILLLVLMSSRSDSDVLIMLFAAAFAPTFVAEYRLHKNRAAIFVLNLSLFGFLFLIAAGGETMLLFAPALLIAVPGWIAALVWSFTANREASAK